LPRPCGRSELDINEEQQRGQCGWNMVSKGENGRSQVGWGPIGQHGRFIWVMTVLRDPLGQLQKE